MSTEPSSLLSQSLQTGKETKNLTIPMMNNELRQNYYDYFQENSNNMKRLWSGIKTIVSQKSSTSSSTVHKMKDDLGNVTSDPSEISNIFNEFPHYCLR